MRSRRRASGSPAAPLVVVLFALTILLPAAAFPGGDAVPIATSPPREDPFVVRPFQAFDDGRWLGNAVCYGPHRDGQRPGGPEPSAAELREDLRLMAPHWGLLRVYGASGFAGDLLALIRDEGWRIKTVLGVWIAPDDTAANRREIEAAVRLAAAFPEIVSAVCVGNETQVSWSGHRCAPAVLTAALREVRARVAAPVTTADDFSYWLLPESRAIAAEVDFVTAHVHPLWNGRQLEEALAWTREQTAAVRARHPDRAVVLGETGWATSALSEGEQGALIKGRTGEAEQWRFHAEIRAWAAAETTTVFFFEAFDENWKGGGHPDEVEKHWGLFRADRTPKSALRPEP